MSWTSQHIDTRELVETQDQNFVFPDPYPYQFSTNDFIEEQWQQDPAFDSSESFDSFNSFASFDLSNLPPLPSAEWTNFGTALINAPVEAVEFSPVEAQSLVEDPTMTTESLIKEDGLDVMVAQLQERTEKLEKVIEDLKTEREEERNRLCAEIEMNVQKLENWNIELKQMVVSLFEELNGGNETLTPS